MTMHEAGTGFSDIGRALGVHYMTVSKWWDRYQAGGMEAIAAWLKTESPRIKRRAVAEGAEIHWGDETSLSPSDPRGHSVAPKSQTPVRTFLSQRRSVRFRSTISNTGTLRFMVLKNAIDAPTLVTFFRRLCKEAGRKVFVILNNLNVHEARDVRVWVEAHAEAIALFCLPSYSPELNLDEYLNGDLKLSVAKRAPARDHDAVLRTATTRLRSLQRHPEQVKNFFRHPRVRYAA